MNIFRAAVMAEIDDAHEMTDGSTPDHIIVSEAIWRDLRDSNNFQVLAQDKRKNWRENDAGYLGMHVWCSAALDSRDKDALLLSEKAFDHLFPQSKDFYVGSY